MPPSSSIKDLLATHHLSQVLESRRIPVFPSVYVPLVCLCGLLTVRKRKARSVAMFRHVRSRLDTSCHVPITSIPYGPPPSHPNTSSSRSITKPSRSSLETPQTTSEHICSTSSLIVSLCCGFGAVVMIADVFGFIEFGIIEGPRFDSQRCRKVSSVLWSRVVVG